MKKFFNCLIILIITSLLVSSCTSYVETAAEKTQWDIENEIGEYTERLIQLDVSWMYDIRSASVTTYVRHIDSDRYRVTGKVSVIDVYGDKGGGNYEAIIYYDRETEQCEAVDWEIDDLRYTG